MATKISEKKAEALAREVLELRELEKEAREARAKAEEQLLMLLGLTREADGEAKAGRYTVRVKVARVRRLDTRALRRELPDLADKFMVESARTTIEIK